VKRQLIWTFLTEISVLAAGILVFRFAAQLLGPEGFGQYTVSRRVVGLIQLPSMLGFGIAIPRYLAIATSQGERPDQTRYYVAVGVGCPLLLALAIGLLGATAPRTVARLAFGTSQLEGLVLPVMLALLGSMAHNLAYAVLRGELRMKEANALQFVNLALWPLLAFALAPRSAAGVILVLAAAWILMGGLALTWVLRPFVQGMDLRRTPLVAAWRELLDYGLPRVPGELALVALFAMPPLVLAHSAGIVQAGHLSFALSALSMIGSLFAPIGLILLPRASAQGARGQFVGLRRDIGRLLGLALPVTALGVALGEIAAPWAVRWYLGVQYDGVTPLLRWLLVGALPYVTYLLLRNLLDALSPQALNSRNLAMALGVVGICSLARRDPVGLALNVTAGLLVLGWLSWRHARRLLRGEVALTSLSSVAPGAPDAADPSHTL
jgi:O-antigen/teichoic acid export membrane protein